MPKGRFHRDSIALRYVTDVAEAATIEAIEVLFDDLPVEIHQREDGIVRSPETPVTSIVTLSGKVSGLISLHASTALAGHIARSLFKSKSGEQLSDDDVRDSFGELCNILAGSIRTQCGEKLHLKINVGMPLVILQSQDDAIPRPPADVTAAIIHAKVAFCPLTLYLCLTVNSAGN